MQGGDAKQREDLVLSRTERNGGGFPHATQNRAQFKTYDLCLEFFIQYFWTVDDPGQ